MMDYTVGPDGEILFRDIGGKTFIGLTDTPAAYAGNANKVLFVNATPDAVAFASNLYWDEVNDRVGLGKSNPGDQFTMLGGSFIIRETDDGNDAVEIFAGASSGVVRVLASGATTVQLAGAGNSYINTGFGFAVGNASPSRRMHATDDSASTDIIIPISRIESQVSGGAGAAGHGPGFEYTGETTTTENTLMAVTAARWSTATHASRRARFEIRNYYIANDVQCAVIEAPSSASPDGNPRGTGAVDIQPLRDAATQVASGSYSAVYGGAGNTASGSYATAIGGSLNVADGSYSFAIGRRSDTNNFDGTFVWADSTNAAFTADRTNQFKVRCNGGAAFVTTSTGAATPVAEFNQADVDESFHKFVGDAAAADLTRDLVDEGDVTTATRIGWYKIEILDDGNQITDGTYYVPFYSLT